MSSFEDVIREHLELKRRNSHLEKELPISAYTGMETPGVFDGETEEDQEGAAFDTAEWKGKKRGKAETFLESLEDVWSSGPVFDWGDKTA